MQSTRQSMVGASLSLLTALAAGCSRDPVGGGDSGGSGTIDGDPTDPSNPSDPTSDTGPDPSTISLTVNKDVDILFVIDNSGSMGAAQGRLAASVGALVDVLEDPGVAASLRIGITTTDNGNPWCTSTGPEAGELQLSSCRGRTGEFVFNGNPPVDATAVACTDQCSADTLEILPTTTEYDAQPRPRPWLESTAGVNNVGGGLTTAEAFQCAGPQGIAGCGFESHLESMYKAFLRAQNDAEAEFGFLRSNAVLSIVILSDEVDCSYNNDFASIFLGPGEGGNGVFWSDPDAASPTSAVCWNAGVVCDGNGAPYDGCRSSNKDVDGATDVPDDAAVLQPLGRYVDFVQELEQAKQTLTPNQEVLVSVIGGVPPGYDGQLVYSNSLDPVDQDNFGIGPGCVLDDGDPNSPPLAARPPVRMREFAEAFEVSGRTNLHSICQDDYSGALLAIADAIRDQITPACMPACVADTDLLNAGLQPGCTLIQESPDAVGGIVEIAVEPCAPGGQLPDGADVCYVALVDDALSDFCADQGWNLEFQLIRRAGVPAPGGTSVSASCELSSQKQIDCPNLP